ncbi:hypothetical protein Barb4_01349 [Bacteroidales bacterium Barb4]|nr:hypothetical protein Barb4_01349 [Bacteroidales bacterium Barb4]
MGQYYYLIAGLPDIALDDGKIPFPITTFRTEAEGALTPKDKAYIDLFFLKFDNKNLLGQLRTPAGYVPDSRGSIPSETFAELIEAIKGEAEDEKKFLALHKYLPAYFAEFVRLYLSGMEKEAPQVTIPWEDRLAALYYSRAMKTGNKFVAEWFELNLNINNLLSAFTARKYGLDKADYIVGDNETARLLRTSNARDFGLGDAVEYLPAVQRIAEETDLFLREKKLDQLKWEWLEEQTFFKTFDIESVFAFLLRLEMLERWVTLDKAAGERTFRELVGAMKKGSNNILKDFKRNNN